jgi:hypothetical protein
VRLEALHEMARHRPRRIPNDVNFRRLHDSDKVSLPWQSVGGTRLAGGKVWIYRKGGSKPVLAVPLAPPELAAVPLRP